MCTGLHTKYPSFFSILRKLEFSRHNFEKYSNIKFHENPSKSSSFSRGQTWKHDETNSRFLKFCKKRLMIKEIFIDNQKITDFKLSRLCIANGDSLHGFCSSVLYNRDFEGMSCLCLHC